MVNTLLTIDMITREAVSLFKNSNAFLQSIDRQYTPEFAKVGAKIGQSLRIRLPNDYVAVTGPDVTGQVQSTNEQQTPLAVATQKTVPVQFTSAERTMSLDDFSKRVAAPMINNLAGAIAGDVMNVVDTVPNIVFNTDGSGGLLAPTASTLLQAQASLEMNSCPTLDRSIIMSPLSSAQLVDSLKGLFNPNTSIAKNYMSGRIVGETFGFDIKTDQSVKIHTNGTFTAGTVNGAGQSGSTLTVNAITGTLNKGDIITIAGVNSVNRVTKVDTGQLRQFVVTANVLSGATSIPIYPALVPPSGGNPVPYQTVAASPANTAAITLVGGASLQYVKNFAFTKEAFTLVTADLTTDLAGAETSREMFDSISLRMAAQNQILTDQQVTRADVLYGYAGVRPEWACIIACPVPTF